MEYRPDCKKIVQKDHQRYSGLKILV